MGIEIRPATAGDVEAIAALESDGRLAEQSYVVRLVAAARVEEPEATFAELAERLGLHRSAVQRALDRVERLSLHSHEGVGTRRLPRGGTSRGGTTRGGTTRGGTSRAGSGTARAS